jgi:uncharacterized protein (TIGR03086 family)
MGIAEKYRKAVDEFDARVQKVDDDAWDKQTTCCPDWTVRDLVNHVVGEHAWVAPLLSGKTIAEVGSSLDGDLLGDDPRSSWRSAADQAMAAVESEGALERTVELSSGPATGEHYVAEVLADQIIHTWDLATSVGADDRLDPELLEYAKQTLEPLVEMWRAGGAFGPALEVPDDADDQTRLLALLGRRS